MTKKLTVVVAVLIATTIAVALPAAAQYAQPSVLSASNGDGSSGCVPGTPVTFTVTGAAAGSQVTVVFRPDAVVLGQADADADGVAVIQAAWPTNPSPGNQTVTANGIDADGNPLDAGAIAVQCEVSAAAAAALPRTGSDSLPWARLGLSLLALGGLLVFTTRRRLAPVREHV